MGDDGEHWYPNPRDPQTMDPSATTMLAKVHAIDALAPAAAYITADTLLDLRDKGQLDGERGQLRNWAATEYKRQWGEKADAGTATHKILEAGLLNRPAYLDEREEELAEPFRDSIADFLTNGGFVPQAAEARVHKTGPGLNWCGTLDTFGHFTWDVPVYDLVTGQKTGEIPAGTIGDGDLKTGEHIRPSAIVQLALYSMCDLIYVSHLEAWDVKPVTSWGFALHVRPDGWSIEPVIYNDHLRAACHAVRLTFEGFRRFVPEAWGAKIRNGGHLELRDLPGIAPTVAARLALMAPEQGGPVVTLADLERLGEARYLAVKGVGPAAASRVPALLALEGRSWTPAIEGKAA